MKPVETKLKKSERERDELLLQVVAAEKAVVLLKIPGANEFIELVKEWVNYQNKVLQTLDPLDENLQLRYYAAKETKDFLSARVNGMSNAEKNLLKLQVILRDAEIELKKQRGAVREAEKNQY